jgi:DNA helicase II / ATP-dependent DNA helicase PcrA
MTGPLAPDLDRVLRPPDDVGRAELERVLAALNQPQRQVATRGAGPLLVVAGPGAGKTRAIIARIAHLLIARGVSPRQVMAVTFSRRAAGELQARLAALLPELYGESGPPPIWAGTFHALGARVLRRGGARLFGRPDTFTIYDRDDTDRALRRILAAMEVQQGTNARLVSAARQAISLAKRRGDPAQGEVAAGEAVVPLDEVYRRYTDELRAAAAFDFDDLVGAAAEALDRDAALREWAQGFTRHLLVDEYQDTDPAQERLLRRLSPAPHDLCVVADPQQSIYAFRGAVPEQVQRFLEHWPAAGVVRLEQNYRSTRNVVAIARRLVAPFSSAVLRQQGTSARRLSLALRMWTDNPAGEPARLWVAPHPEKEADAIGTDVAAKLEAGWRPDEIAVLVRTHAQARPIEAALLRAKVPYALVGGVRFYGREEIKDLLAYLRLAVAPSDQAAFWRVINTPRRGLGPAALMSIARHALLVDTGGSLPGARLWAARGGAPEGLYDFLAHVDELTALERSGAGPRAVLDAAVTLTGYRDHVRKVHLDDAPARLDAIGDLLRIAEQHRDARRFLDEAALSTEEDDAVPTAGRVRVSTVHAAKGLEFRAVYVPGCEMGLFPLAPGRRAAGAEPEPDEITATLAGPPPPATPPDRHSTRSTQITHHFAEGADPEERRVFYVAITRAREELTLSYCTFRRDQRTQPSPYLREIGSGLLRRAKLGTSEPPAPRKRAAKGGKSPSPPAPLPGGEGRATRD